MRLFEVAHERVDQLFLDMQNTAANLADGVVVVATGQLVMSGALAEVGCVNRSRCRECLERAVHGAARKPGLGLVQLIGNLLGGAVAAEPHDGVINHRPLSRAPHARCEHQESDTTCNLRSALDSTRHPPDSTTTSSSIRM